MTNSKEAVKKILEAEPLSSGLRKASYLAQDVGASDLELWLRLELGGYFRSNSAMRDDVEVPEYRTVVGEHYDLFGRRLVLPADLSFVAETRLRYGVEELEGLASSRHTVVVHDPTMCELIRTHLGVEVYSFHFSTIHLRGVLSAIRTELDAKLRHIKLPDSNWVRSSAHTEEVFQLRPNFHGLGVDLRALWRRWRGPK